MLSSARLDVTDGSPFTLNGVTSSVAELNCGSVGLRCMRCLRQELNIFQLFERQRMRQLIKLPFMQIRQHRFSQSDRVYGYVSRPTSSKKKDGGPNSVDGRICTQKLFV